MRATTRGARTKTERIGAGAVIGVGSVVTRDVPDGAIAAGNPGRVLRAAAALHANHDVSPIRDGSGARRRRRAALATLAIEVVQRDSARILAGAYAPCATSLVADS